MNNSTLVPYNVSSADCSSLVSTMFASILAVISSAAFIGNILVVTSFIKTPSLRTSTNFYIVNMAVSDFLGPLFNWPLYASEGMLTPNIFINERWAAPVCKLGMYFRVVSQAVSVLCLLLIALDRFVAIIYPLKVVMITVKIRVILLSLSWLIPIVWFLPYVLFANIIKVEDRRFCRFMTSDRSLTIFYGVSFVCFYLFPLITIIVLYSVITRASKKRPRPVKILNAPENVKRRQQNQRIVKIMISIVFAFFVCWTPLCVYLYLKKIYPSLQSAKDRCLLLLGFTFYVFPSLSTAINPVILFVFSTNYNQALKSFCSQVFSVCKCGFHQGRPVIAS